MSVSTFEMKGFTTTVADGKCTVKKNYGSVVLIDRRVNGIYLVEATMLKPEIRNMIAENKVPTYGIGLGTKVYKNIRKCKPKKLWKF